MARDTETAPGQAASIVATPAALALIDRLRAAHGPLMFHLSGGCCEGSAPMCLPEGELLLGADDLLLGTIGGCPFYVSADQYRRWGRPQLTVDAAPGASDSFSLEGLLGMHFLTLGSEAPACALESSPAR